MPAGETQAVILEIASTPSPHEPLLPTADGGLGDPGPTHDLGGAIPVGREQDDV